VLVFISYHTPDQEKADAVVSALKLRRPGIECYLAPRNITGGARWVPGIAGAVARADAMLFLAGRRIGPWQELEYYEALGLSRQGTGRPRLIPVVFADQAPGLPFFAQLHRISTADPAARDTLDAIERALDDTLPADATPAWQRFHPYKGLPALEEADAAFFFGRDAETADTLERMAHYPDRIVALIGQSGVGARLKSQL
jgi:TIR domain